MPFTFDPNVHVTLPVAEASQKVTNLFACLCIWVLSDEVYWIPISINFL